MKRLCRRMSGFMRVAPILPLIISAAVGQEALAAYTRASEDARPVRTSHVVQTPSPVGSATVSVVVAKAAASKTAPRKPVVVLPEVKADRTALLIGVNNAPGSPPLEGSIADARNMNQALLGYGFKAKNIHFLADPTRRQILDGLASLVARTSGKGLAVFLISTHSKRSGGTAVLATGGGGRISAPELASSLARVPGKLWSMIPTCYSGAYRLPGVVGRDRIAVFSSAADEYSYQLGGAGSWLVLYMVKYAMLQKEAPSSVEAAYLWTKRTLDRSFPNRSPLLSDGIHGTVVLEAVSK